MLLTDGSAYQAINSSENGLQLARTSNILQRTATDDDIFFDEMLNQVQFNILLTKISQPE